MSIPSTNLSINAWQAWMKTQRTLFAEIAVKGVLCYVTALFLIKFTLGTFCGLQL